MTGITVYAVHVNRRDHIGHTEVVYCGEDQARTHAQERSTDVGVTGAGVTRYVVGVHGARLPVAWYVSGSEQSTPWPLG